MKADRISIFLTTLNNFDKSYALSTSTVFLIIWRLFFCLPMIPIILSGIATIVIYSKLHINCFIVSHAMKYESRESQRVA